MKNQQEIIKLYNEGFTYTEISEELKMKIGTINGNIGKLLKNKKIERRGKGHTNPMNRIKTKEKIIKLYNKGLTYNDIAKKLNRNGYTIKKYIWQMQNQGIIKLRRGKSEKEINTYKPPKLKIDKSYIFRESFNDAHGKIQGKVIEETDHFYRINTGNYIECINKNNMMHLDIKEVS